MKLFRIAPLFCLAATTVMLLSPAPAHAQRLTNNLAPSSSGVKAGAKKQEPLTGFLGVKWGDSLEQAKKNLEAKGATTAKFSGSDSNAKDINARNVLWVTNVKVADFGTQNAILRFGTDGFYQANVVFSVPSGMDNSKLYEELRLIITERFGEAMTDRPVGRNGGIGFSNTYSEWNFDRSQRETASLKLLFAATPSQPGLEYRATDRAEREEARIRAEKAKLL